MKDARSREEYVLNDHGAVFWGGRKPKPWYFGQVGVHSISRMYCYYYLGCFFIFLLCHNIQCKY